MFFSLIKEINILLSKGMLNICLKFTIEKKLRSHAGINEFPNFLLQLKNQRSGIKTMCGFSFTFILKGILTF